MKSENIPVKIVALLCATATAGYICRVNVSTAGAMMMKEFGLDQPAMGRVFSAFLLGYALCQIPGGAVADRWGARRTLRALPWLWVGFTAALAPLGFGPLAAGGAAINGLLAARFLLGTAEAPTYPASARGVAGWVAPSGQGRANGIVIASIGLGSAIASPLVSSLMVKWGWRVAILVSAIPSLAVALIWLRFREPQPYTGDSVGCAAAEQQAVPGVARLGSGSFVLLTISYTLQGYVGYIFVFWFYLYLVQERHFEMISGAWVNSMSWILSIALIPLGGFVSDRLAARSPAGKWGRRIVPIAGMAGSGILISVGAHTGSALVAACALALATGFVLSVEGPFWAMMIRLAGPNSGTAGGIMNMGSNIGGLISPALTPLIASWIGWENALHVAAGLAIIASLLWLGITSPTRETNPVLT